MFDFYRVAAAIPDIKVADVEYNLTQIMAKLDELKNESASVVVFPELCTTGYTCGDLFYQSTLIRESNNAIKQVVEKSEDYDRIIVLGAPLSVGSQLFNAALVIYRGKICGITVKTFIPNHNEFYEKRWFSSALDLKAEEISSSVILGAADASYSIPIGNNIIYSLEGNYSFGIEICEDVWSPLTPSTILALGGAELIINLSASNETIGKREYRSDLIKNKSASLLCDYLYVSAGSGESTTDLIFSGHSILAENGRLLMQNEDIAANNYIACSDIDMGRIRADRLKSKTHKDAFSYYVEDRSIRTVNICTNRDYSSDASLYKIKKHPFIPSSEAARLERCKNIFAMQVGGLYKRAQVTGGKLVVGVSGGMDSTLTLLVCAQTLKKLGRPMSDLVGITMPAFGTTDRTYNNSIKLMETLGTTIVTIPIKDACLLHYKDIGHDYNTKDVTFENVQARERTQVLMDYANKIGGIVVGTGDLSELALGWCTYNADQMSMYGVNASIPKTLVKWLIASVIKHNIFPESTEVLNDIIDTPISPELLPPDENGNISQKTEDSVGPYELHDFFLYYMMRFGYSPAKIYYMAQKAFGDVYDNETILKWMRMFYRRFFTQQFKRSCMPDGVKVGSVCLSPRGDFRMPSDASYNIWMKELDELK